MQMQVAPCVAETRARQSGKTSSNSLAVLPEQTALSLPHLGTPLFRHTLRVPTQLPDQACCCESSVSLLHHAAKPGLAYGNLALLRPSCMSSLGLLEQ